MMKLFKKILLVAMIAVLSGLAHLACQDEQEVSKTKTVRHEGPDKMVVEGDD